VGATLTAEVLDGRAPGMIALRIARLDGKESLLEARTTVPLTAGDVIRIKVLEGGAEIRLQLLPPETSPSPEAEMRQAVLGMLDRLSAARLTGRELALLRQLFGRIPETLLREYPELEALARLMPDVERLNAEALRSSVEGSGVLFETRLKLAAQEYLRSGDGALLKRLASEPDQKGLLLRLQALLEDETLAAELRTSGNTPADLAGAVDRLLKHIEFFQLSSSAGEALSLFLPLGWQELRDGELTFRKGRRGGADAYSCDIRLDLEPAGRLAIAVTMVEGGFYVSLRAEKAETRARLASERGTLEKIFTDAGLPLKAISVGDARDGEPWNPALHDLDVTA
jgi:hypothetical protein